MKIWPNENILEKWNQNFIPQYDIYFFKDKPSILPTIPIAEYLKEFKDFEYINAYEYWKIKKKTKYVFVDKNNCITNYNIQLRNRVYKNQILTNRGLVIKAKLSDHFNLSLLKGLYGNKLIISNSLFNKLSYQERKSIILRYTLSVEDNDCEECHIDTPSYIRKIANTYVEENGCNCLAVVLYCITKNASYLKRQVEDKEFSDYINSNYEQCDLAYEKGNIIVFKDDKNNIIHSFYIINNNYCINKSGQLRYNPITIKKIDDVIKNWNNNYICMHKINLSLDKK